MRPACARSSAMTIEDIGGPVRARPAHAAGLSFAPSIDTHGGGAIHWKFHSLFVKISPAVPPICELKTGWPVE